MVKAWPSGTRHCSRGRCAGKNGRRNRKAKREVEIHTLDEALLAQVRARVTTELEAKLDAPHMKLELYSGIDELRETVLQNSRLKMKHSSQPLPKPTKRS